MTTMYMYIHTTKKCFIAGMFCSCRKAVSAGIWERVTKRTPLEPLFPPGGRGGEGQERRRRRGEDPVLVLLDLKPWQVETRKGEGGRREGNISETEIKWETAAST